MKGRRGVADIQQQSDEQVHMSTALAVTMLEILRAAQQCSETAEQREAA